MYFYVTVIRSVLEYVCPVWHFSLTAAQKKALESLQRRAMRIIFRTATTRCRSPEPDSKRCSHDATS